MRKGIFCLALVVALVLSSVACCATPVEAGSYIWTRSSQGMWGGDVGALAKPQARRLFDAPWSANVQVNDDAETAQQTWPAVAVDASGNAYAVWEDPRNGHNDIYFSYRPAGGSWETNVRVNDDPGTTYQGWPAIAVDPSSNTYVVWQDHRNGNWDKWDIYFSYRPAGGSWETNVRVNDDPGTADREYPPAIAVDPSGNAYAVWTDLRNGNDDIYFSYRPAGGSWETNVRVNDDSGTASQSSRSIGVDPSGNAYAVWEDYRNGNWDIYFSYRPAGGSWETNVRVNDDPGTAKQWWPAIGVDPSGNAYAVWEDYRNGNLDIYFSYQPAGGSWETNVRVNDDPGTAFQGAASIGVDPSGNAYAMWIDDRNGNWDIYFSYRPAGYEIYLPLILKNH